MGILLGNLGRESPFRDVTLSYRFLSDGALWYCGMSQR